MTPSIKEASSLSSGENPDTPLRIVGLNVRSLNTLKQLQVRELLAEDSNTALVFLETWLSRPFNTKTEKFKAYHAGATQKKSSGITIVIPQAFISDILFPELTSPYTLLVRVRGAITDTVILGVYLPRDAKISANF